MRTIINEEGQKYEWLKLHFKQGFIDLISCSLLLTIPFIMFEENQVFGMNETQMKIFLELLISTSFYFILDSEVVWRFQFGIKQARAGISMQAYQASFYEAKSATKCLQILPLTALLYVYISFKSNNLFWTYTSLTQSVVQSTQIQGYYFFFFKISVLVSQLFTRIYRLQQFEAWAHEKGLLGVQFFVTNNFEIRSYNLGIVLADSCYTTIKQPGYFSHQPVPRYKLMVDLKPQPKVRDGLKKLSAQDLQLDGRPSQLREGIFHSDPKESPLLNLSRDSLLKAPTVMRPLEIPQLQQQATQTQLLQALPRLQQQQKMERRGKFKPK